MQECAFQCASGIKAHCSQSALQTNEKPFSQPISRPSLQVWPGAVHYPDYSHPAAQDWWFKHLSDWHKQLPFDGLWIDMNE